MAGTKKQKVVGRGRANIRWMIRGDLPAVVEIERQCFEYPWGLNDFTTSLRERDTIGMVAELGGEIVGFMVYTIGEHEIRLIDIAVSYNARRRGVGSLLVTHVIDKMLAKSMRARVVLDVRESNLAAQLFFKICGFRAVGIQRALYDETPEDAYRFVHSRHEEAMRQEAGHETCQ